MNCVKCDNTELQSTFKFCPMCGVSTKSLAYQNPMGTWIVTTEGDCEGRSIRDLGIHTGYVDEIAKRLASRCGYTLRFEDCLDAGDLDNIESPEHGKVVVKFGYQGNSDIKRLTEVFRDRPVTITKSNINAAFNIEW